MKNYRNLFSILLLLVLALAACTGGEQQTPAAGGVETTSSAGELSTATETVPTVGTEVAATEALATEASATAALSNETVSTTAPVATEGTQAATEVVTVEPTQALPNTGPVDNSRVSTLMGQPAYSSDGQSAGTVEDLAINLASSQVDYLILRPEGQEGEDGFIPVPWRAFSFDNGLVLSVDQEVYQGAPTMDIKASPFLIPSDWDEFFAVYWNDSLGPTVTVTDTVSPEVTETVSPTLEGVILGREILDQEIQGPNGDTVGKVSDLMLDPNNGQVRYLILNIGEGTEARTIPVPLWVLERPASNKPFVLPLDANTLSRVPEINLDNLDLTSNAWDEAFRSFWEGIRSR